MSFFGCCSVCTAAAGGSSASSIVTQATLAPQGAPVADPPKSPSSARRGGGGQGNGSDPRAGGSNLDAQQGGGKQLLPYKRQKSRRHITAMMLSEADGGTGGSAVPASVFNSEASKIWNSQSVPDVEAKSKACKAMLNYSRSQVNLGGLEPGSRAPGMLSGAGKKGFKRYDSQLDWNKAEQTIIVFDWDDTLFPTFFIQEDLQLNWQLPLQSQRLSPQTMQSVKAKLAACEERAVETLERASELGHVVIVTLASTGWVDMACKHFYPAAGKVLESRNIKVVHAQEKVMKGGTKHYSKEEFQSNEDLERFWGLVKGQAISEEVEAFYSQYEGQSWKNILSIGDSCFERYGLLAATSAYMQDRKVNHAEAGQEVWAPTEEGKWEKDSDGRTLRVRAKVCKLVDQPDIDELIIQLEMITKWLEAMVNLNDGFDLDLEALDTEDQVEIIESVLRGNLPASRLPKPPAEAPR